MQKKPKLAPISKQPFKIIQSTFLKIRDLLTKIMRSVLFKAENFSSADSANLSMHSKVPYICFSLRLLVHESRDLSQAETKIILVKS